MVHHILYIPGLGDHHPFLQTRVVKRWDKLGVKTHFIQIKWADNEPFESKLARVIKKIDELVGPENRISLVGVSAGASMALNAYMARKNKVSGVVYICGKLSRPELIGESYSSKNPAFKKSAIAATASIDKLSENDKARMLTIRSIYDGTIPAQDTRITGVKNHTLPVLLHVPTISLAITVFRKVTISFLKSRT